MKMPDYARDLVGEQVRFRSESNYRKVLSASHDGMLEVEGFVGLFGVHLFAVLCEEEDADEIRIGDGYNLHVDREGREVWLDTEVAPYDGICLGTGDDKKAALEDARNSLLLALRQVEAEIKVVTNG